jgi:hypothetical protein
VNTEKETEAIDRLEVLEAQVSILKDKKKSKISSKSMTTKVCFLAARPSTIEASIVNFENQMEKAIALNIPGLGLLVSSTSKAAKKKGKEGADLEKDDAAEPFTSKPSYKLATRTVKEARQALKLALSEFYRFLELLKNYKVSSRRTCRALPFHNRTRFESRS